MNKNLKVTVKVIDNVDCKYLDTKIYNEENLKEFTVKEVIYFVFQFFEQIEVLFFHALAVLF